MEATKRCPFCAEEILAEAIKCKHCQADLTRGPAKGPHDAIGLALLAVPVVAAVVEWNLVRHENLLQRPDQTVIVAGGVAVAVTALLAAIEASMLGYGTNVPGDQSRRESSPLTWFAGLLLLWPVTFPWYFSTRKRLVHRGLTGVAVVVAALFVITSAALLHQIESAKTEVREALAALGGTDPDGRAQDSLPKPSGPRLAPTWRETRQPSPMEDVPRIVVSRESDEAITDSDGKDLFPQIIIRCIKGKTDAYVDVKMPLNGQVRTWDDGYSWGSSVRTPVRARLDAEKTTSGWWLLSDDREGVFLSRPVDFVKGLMKHHQFRVEVESSQAGTQSILFSLAGLDETIKGLRSTCRW